MSNFHREHKQRRKINYYRLFLLPNWLREVKVRGGNDPHMVEVATPRLIKRAMEAGLSIAGYQRRGTHVLPELLEQLPDQLHDPKTVDDIEYRYNQLMSGQIPINTQVYGVI